VSLVGHFMKFMKNIVKSGGIREQLYINIYDIVTEDS
jgi:hypothetical protein